jgi:hypothetical protein
VDKGVKALSIMLVLGFLLFGRAASKNEDEYD